MMGWWDNFVLKYKAFDRTGETIQLDGADEDRFSWKRFLAFVGPGFLISIAYIDPGNFLTDIQAGARMNYRLLWVVIVSSFLGLLLQMLCARLGVVTGHHLAYLCRHEYGDRTRTTISLWLLTELTIICSDIPEVIGSAFALDMLFGIPLWGGVLITSLSTLMLLGVQYFGVRKLEIMVGLMVVTMGVCFLVESILSPIEYGAPNCPSDWCAQFQGGNDDEAVDCPRDYCGNVWGGLVPYMDGNGIAIAVGLVGAVVMPHNLYLHSGLVQSRGVDRHSPVQLKWALRYNGMEAALGLGLSCLINIAVLTVSAAVFYPNPHNGYSQVNDIDEVGFDDAELLLSNAIGSSGGLMFAISLLASGQSSTITGTYAGQFVMEGFLDLRMPKLKRNILTRCVAIVPSLLVSVLAGKGGSNLLIIISSIVLSFQLPFALIPLLKFTQSEAVMGEHRNSSAMMLLCSSLASVVVLANCYLMLSTMMGLELSPGVAGVVWTLASLLAVAYFTSLAHLLKKPLALGTTVPLPPPVTDDEDDFEMMCEAHDPPSHRPLVRPGGGTAGSPASSDGADNNDVLDHQKISVHPLVGGDGGVEMTALGHDNNASGGHGEEDALVSALHTRPQKRKESWGQDDSA